MKPCQVVWAPPQLPVVEVEEAPMCQICDNRVAVGLAALVDEGAKLLQRFDGCSICIGVTGAKMHVGYKSKGVYFVHSQRELDELAERIGLTVQHEAVCNCP